MFVHSKRRDWRKKHDPGPEQPSLFQKQCFLYALKTGGHKVLVSRRGKWIDLQFRKTLLMVLGGAADSGETGGPEMHWKPITRVQEGNVESWAKAVMVGTEILGMLGRENFGCWFCLGEKRQLRMTQIYWCKNWMDGFRCCCCCLVLSSHKPLRIILMSQFS